MKKFYLIIAVISVIIIGLGAILIINWVKPIPDEAVANAQFSAIVEDEGGVDTGSAFRLLFDTEISSASVRRALTISPEIEVGVHQGTSKNEVLVAPASPLEPGTIYTFQLRSDNQQLQWAIQTKQDLTISEVRPADKTLRAPTTSAIEIVLNQLTSVDLAKAADYISITPSIAGHFEQEGRILRFVPEAGLAAGTVYHVKISAGLPLVNSDITLAEGYEFSFETLNTNAALWQAQGQSAYLESELPQFVLTTVDGNPFAQLPGAESAVDLRLYQFATAADYEQVLQEMLASKPSWSESFAYLTVADAATLQLVGDYQVGLAIDASSATLTLPQYLSGGYYLLRCTYAGQSMDMLFAVSELAAYIHCYGNKTIFWLHDAITGEPLNARITDESGFVVSSSSDNGVSIAERIGDAVYYLTTDDGRSLVIPYYQTQLPSNEDNNNWRYLYLDQSSYQSGDTLNYWGMVEPRNGADLEYERVSVCIYADSYGEYIYRDYAPLNKGIFSGNILLPSLLEGSYCLQILQSGNVLVSQEFTIGEAENIAKEQLDAITGSILELDKEAYLPGESFQASVAVEGQEYLFIEENNGAISAAGGQENVYEGVFAPANQLNSYLAAVAYRDGHYYSSAPYLMQRDCSPNTLDIDISGSLLGERSAEDGALTISVADSAGRPVAADIAVAIIQSEQQPDIDTVEAVFADYGGNTGNNTVSGQSLFFATGKTDDEGQTVCQYQLPEFSGKCWLVVQAIDAGADIQVGSIVLSFGQGSGATGEEGAMELPESPSLPEFAYQIEPLTPDTVLNANSILTIFGSQERLEVLSLLLNQVFAYAHTTQHTTSATAALAASHARQLLLDYGGDFLSGLLVPAIDVSSYQQPDGGIGDLKSGSSLPVSVKAVAAAPNNIDYYALVAYYQTFLENHSSRLERAMALTGLALYGNPVLNDIKIMLASENLSTEEYLWLIWGLYVSGDRRNATLELDSLLAQTENLEPEAAVLAGIVASLCGRDDALDWLSIAIAGGIDTNLEQVLIVRVMLPQLLQPQSSFSYHINDEAPVEAQMQGYNDFIFNSSSANTITFDAINGDIYYLDIYTLEE